jgi:hypothetical protein
MTSGVAKVKTLPAAIPPHSALDRDAPLLETKFPRGQSLDPDGESQVHGAVPVVLWNPTARCVQASNRRAPPEEEQDGPLARVHRYQARTRVKYAKAKNVSIKSDDNIEIVDVESGLKDARDGCHRNQPCGIEGRRCPNLVACSNA